jgi:WD40-like Beta Propeller Repeat
MQNKHRKIFQIYVLLIALGTVAVAYAQKFSDWSPPVNLGATVNSTTGDFLASISKDGLSLYFTSQDRPGGYGGWDIWVSKRASVNDPWGVPENLGAEINTSFNEGSVSLSIDGHLMYFASDRPGGFGGNDIYISRRHDKRDDLAWQAPQNVGNAVNTSSNEASPAIFEDDESGATTLYFDSNRPGGPGPFTDDGFGNGSDIYASIMLPDDTFGSTTLVAELSTASLDRQPAPSRDGREMLLTSNRPGTLGGLDLWVSTRATTTDQWSEPVNLGAVVNSAVNDAGPALSFNGTTLYFQSGRPGGVGAFDLYVTARTKLKTD